MLQVLQWPLAPVAVTRELETPIRAVPHGALLQASKQGETISSAAQGLCSDPWRLAPDYGQKNVLYWEHNNLAANLLLPNDSHAAMLGLITLENTSCTYNRFAQRLVSPCHRGVASTHCSAEAACTSTQYTRACSVQPAASL